MAVVRGNPRERPRRDRGVVPGRRPCCEIRLDVVRSTTAASHALRRCARACSASRGACTVFAWDEHFRTGAEWRTVTLPSGSRLRMTEIGPTATLLVRDALTLEVAPS
jgi:hypothetical protein